MADLEVLSHMNDEEYAGDEAEFLAELLEKTWKNARRTPLGLADLAGTAIRRAACVSVVEPDDSEIHRLLQTAVTALTSLFRLATANATELDVDPGDGVLARIPTAGAIERGDVNRWLNAFFLACTCRDEAALGALVEVPPDRLRKAVSKSDDYAYLLVDTLQKYWKHDPGTPRQLALTLKATDPAHLKLAPEEWVLDIDVPLIDVFWRVTEADSPAFQTALVKALEWHKKYWSKNQDRARDPDGFLAIGLLGLTALAWEKGMSLEVESGYVPSMLARREWR